VHKNAQKFERKTHSKISCDYHGKIACLDDTFSEIFELAASPVEGQSLEQKDKKRRKRKGKQTLQKKPKDVHVHVGHFLVQKTLKILDFSACLSKHVVNCNASGRKGMLPCCKCLFE